MEPHQVFLFLPFLEVLAQILIFPVFFFTFSIIFFALGANGIFVLSVIWISSTETIGGKSIGFFAKKGKLNAVIKIMIKCKPDEIIIFLCKFLPFLIRF